MIDYDPRCWRCNRKLAEKAARPWEIVCGRCHATNRSEIESAASAVVAMEA